MLAAKQVQEINLQSPRHLEILDVELSARDKQAVLLDPHLAGLPVLVDAYLVLIARQHQELIGASQLLAAFKHEVTVPAVDIVPDNDIRILLLDKIGPGDQRILLRRVALDHRVMHRVARIHHDAVLEIRLLLAIAPQRRPDERDTVALDLRKIQVQRLGQLLDLGVALAVRIAQQIQHGRLLLHVFLDALDNGTKPVLHDNLDRPLLQLVVVVLFAIAGLFIPFVFFQFIDELVLDQHVIRGGKDRDPLGKLLVDLFLGDGGLWKDPLNAF